MIENFLSNNTKLECYVKKDREIEAYLSLVKESHPYEYLYNLGVKNYFFFKILDSV